MPESPAASPSTHDPSRAPRLVGVDAARVVAILLVVLLHACVAYLERPIAGLLWPVQESSGSTAWVDGLFWIVRTLGVPIVTLIAGFFAARAIDATGPRAFLRERTRRLLVPLLIAACTVLPAMYLVWAWGWVVRGWAAPIHILHVRFGPAVQPNLFGLAHLWYLEYLLVFSVLYAAWRTTLPALAWPARSARVLALPLVRVVAIAAPLALILHQSPGVLLEFQNGFLPQWPKLAWNGVFFIAGVVLARATPTREQLVAWPRTWWLDAPLAIAAAALLVPAARAVIADAADVHTRLRFAILGAILAAAGGVSILASLIHLLRDVNATSPLARRLATLANATFWIYILHLFFQGLASVLLYKMDVPVAIKLAIVFVAGFAGPLACYALARRWQLLAWLRPVRERAAPPHASNDAASARA